MFEDRSRIGFASRPAGVRGRAAARLPPRRAIRRRRHSRCQDQRVTGRRAACIGTAIAAVVVGVSIAGAWWSSVAFPAWWEATSTFAAFAAAGVAVYFVMRQEGRIVDALVREQASKVAAWFSAEIPSDMSVSTRTSIATIVGMRRTGVRIRNASDLPVSSVWVALVHRHQVIGGPFQMGLLPPAS